MFFIRRNAIYLPTFFVSNGGDFCFVMKGIPKTSQPLPKISDDFLKTSELPKMSKDVAMMFVHLQSYLKDNNLACFNFIRTRSHHSRPFWDIFVKIKLNSHY